MRHLWTLILIVFAAPVLAQTPKPVPEVTHAIIITVDGMRPDLALRADMPNLRKLMASGSYSMWARSTELSITLPTHATILTGVPPQTHGLLFNDDGPVDPVYPKVPTLIQLAKKAGYTTAIVTGKSKLGLLAPPGSADHYAVPPRGKSFSDSQVGEAAAKIFAEHQPGFMFVHFANTDSVGHRIGWGSPEQIAVLENADKQIGLLLAAIDSKQARGSTFILVTADHGGRQRWHGPNDPRARHIPWIASGPGIVAGRDLDTIREKQVDAEDSFATTCTMLGIELPANVTGKIVPEILQSWTSKPAKPATVPAPAPTPALAK